MQEKKRKKSNTMSEIIHTFSPVEFLEFNPESGHQNKKRPVILLILNQPIVDIFVGTEKKKHLFWQAWNYCKHNMFFVTKSQSWFLKTKYTNMTFFFD